MILQENKVFVNGERERKWIIGSIKRSWNSGIILSAAIMPPTCCWQDGEYQSVGRESRSYTTSPQNTIWPKRSPPYVPNTRRPPNTCGRFWGESLCRPGDAERQKTGLFPRLLIRKHEKVSKINVFKGREHGTKSKNLILTGTKGADVKISALFLSPRHRQPPYGVFSYPYLYPPEKCIN